MKPRRTATAATENRPWTITGQHTISNTLLGKLRYNAEEEEASSLHITGSGILFKAVKQKQKQNKQIRYLA
jgi:hypothetical protein